MKILVMSLMDSGGGCGKLTRAIDNHSDHQAKGARWLKGKIVSYAVSEKYCQWQPNQNQTKRLIAWSDAVIVTGPLVNHHHSLPWGQSLIPPNSAKRPIVVNYRGTPYRKNKAFYDRYDKAHKILQTGNFIDLLVYGGFKHWLPVPVWIDELKQYRNKQNKFIVAQSVTQDKRSHLKSIPAVRKRLQGLEGIDFDYIHSLEHTECLKRLGSADVVVTAFKNGFGNSGLEAMAMGIPIIGNGFDGYIYKFLELCKELPFYRSTVQYIARSVFDLRDNKELYNEYVRKGYEYLNTYHHPDRVAEKAVNLCHLASQM